MKRPCVLERVLILALILVGVGVSACDESNALDEIVEPEGHSPMSHEEGLLVGTWRWDDVSTIVVDENLVARQTSSLYVEPQTISTYEFTEFGDALVLSGWFASSDECASDEFCDADARRHQTHFMTWYVDEAVFFPYALEQQSGTSVVGTYEGIGLRLQQVDADADADNPMESLDQETWRLELREDSSYISEHTRTVFRDDAGQTIDNPEPVTLEGAAGVWVQEGDRILLIENGSNEVMEYQLRNRHLSLDGLVFERASAPPVP